MRGERIRKIIGVILLVMIASLGFSTEVKNWVGIPTKMVIFEGDYSPVEKATEVLSAMTQVEGQVTAAFEKGQEEHVSLQVAGFPVKNINVSSLPNIEVIPGGQSIGVNLNTDGVLVVGHHLIQAEIGDQSPGEEAGIAVGDMITEIDGEKIKKMNQVSDLIQKAGQEDRVVKMEIKREQETFVKKIKPIKAKSESSYRMGLYIRDSAAGVGTLTFYDPQSKKYGALGHVISDVDTKKPIIVHDGEIVRSSVTSIEKGSNGDPGEKLAKFAARRDSLGTITKNSTFGIFGKLNKNNLTNEIYDDTMPITLSSHVKEGPAKILTVIEDEKVEEFDINIISINEQNQPATKGMIIKVTDERLLEKTGGIIQGMSGSPIIQDNKLVGAVTHVFVNDPTTGYGSHISWMLYEAGITDKDGEKIEAEAS